MFLFIFIGEKIDDASCKDESENFRMNWQVKMDILKLGDVLITVLKCVLFLSILPLNVYICRVTCT